MPDRRPCRVRDFTEHLWPHGDRTPGKQIQVLNRERSFKLVPLRRIVIWQKKGGDSERFVRPERQAHIRQKPLARNCRRNSYAITRFPVRRNGAAMSETGKCCKRMTKNLVRRPSRELRNKPHTAGIRIEAWIDEASVEARRTARGEISPRRMRVGGTRRPR